MIQLCIFLKHVFSKGTVGVHAQHGVSQCEKFPFHAFYAALILN